VSIQRAGWGARRHVYASSPMMPCASSLALSLSMSFVSL